MPDGGVSWPDKQLSTFASWPDDTPFWRTDPTIIGDDNLWYDHGASYPHNHG